MKFWVGVTDNHWFNFLSQQHLDEVNFWQPSAIPLFKSADLTGMPFLFKLKSPFHHIAGGGFYVGYSTMPLDLAWDTFGVSNGASTYHEFLKIIDAKGKIRDNGGIIGCTILSNPFFLPQAQWLAEPPNFPNNIVRGKHYDTDHPDGSMIWQHMSEHLLQKSLDHTITHPTALTVQTPIEKYGLPTLVKPRMGQGAFRMMLTKAYQGRCAMTGENTLEVLEAAHIIPYATHGSHDINNGLLLRADFHKLFDKGLISITPDYDIKISPRIQQAYFNGKAYYRLDNQKLTNLPEQRELWPHRDKLAEHYETRFQR